MVQIELPCVLVCSFSFLEEIGYRVIVSRVESLFPRTYTEVTGRKKKGLMNIFVPRRLVMKTDRGDREGGGWGWGWGWGPNSRGGWV